MMNNTCKDCVAWLMGGCRTMEFCRPEREWLMDEARQCAEQRGHTLTEFVHVKGRPTWQAECAHCGRLAIVKLDPSPDEACLAGEAMTADCQELVTT